MMLAVLGQDAVNFIMLIAAALGLLFFDLALWLKSRKTLSETMWTINQKSLALAFILGLLAGHLLTVPK